MLVTVRHRSLHVDKQTLRQFAKYGIVGVLGFGLHMAFLVFLTEVFGIDYRVSTVFAGSVAWINNFAFNKLWTFKNEGM